MRTKGGTESSLSGPGGLPGGSNAWAGSQMMSRGGRVCFKQGNCTSEGNQRCPPGPSMTAPFVMEPGRRHPDTCPTTCGKRSTEEKVPLPREIAEPESDSLRP